MRGKTSRKANKESQPVDSKAGRPRIGESEAIHTSLTPRIGYNRVSVQRKDVTSVDKAERASDWLRRMS